MKKKQAYSLLSRYLLLVILAIPNLYLFYFFFTPLTVYPVFFILNLFYEAMLLSGNVISFNGLYASIIPACVGGSAYYLLLILNLTTPMPYKKRINSILFLFGTFLALNIIRIVFFAFLVTKGYQYFSLTHELTWYFGSTILVIAIWFANIHIFKIKKIPIYTDIKNIIKDIR